MNNHVTSSLGAYEDGELGGLRLRRVEAHLARCSMCRRELEQLRALRALLRGSPSPCALTLPDRFVALVGQRLLPRPVQPAWRRALGTGWRLMPLGLLGAWAFGQAVSTVAGVVLAGLSLGLGGRLGAGWSSLSQGLWLAQLLRLSGASVSDIARAVPRVLGGAWSLGWGAMLNLILLVAIGLLYWSWLASWWVRRQSRAHPR